MSALKLIFKLMNQSEFEYTITITWSKSSLAKWALGSHIARGCWVGPKEALLGKGFMYIDHYLVSYRWCVTVADVRHLEPGEGMTYSEGSKP